MEDSYIHLGYHNYTCTVTREPSVVIISLSTDCFVGACQKFRLRWASTNTKLMSVCASVDCLSCTGATLTKPPADFPWLHCYAAWGIIFSEIAITPSVVNGVATRCGHTRWSPTRVPIRCRQSLPHLSLKQRQCWHTTWLIHESNNYNIRKNVKVGQTDRCMKTGKQS